MEKVTARKRNITEKGQHRKITAQKETTWKREEHKNKTIQV